MNYYIFILVSLSFIAALIAVDWIYFKILKIAFDKNLVDNPDARKLQKVPVPVMGGMAVFFGVLVGVLVGTVIHSVIGDISSTTLFPIICSMSVMLYVGALDDIMGLSPRSRIIIEILTILGLVFASGACLDSFGGMWGVSGFSWWAAVPLTVFAGVGIINAVNMIDGVNGLSSGLCITCCLFFGAAFINIGDISNAVLAFTTFGALMPFFIHNVFGMKSRMYIGDAGTMAMGVLLTWFTICLVGTDRSVLCCSQDINTIALSLAVLSVPVFDTLRVMGLRIIHKKSPFHPDKTHLHHIFINVGVSHFITSMSIILIDIVVVGILTVSVTAGAGCEWQLYIVMLSSIILVWGTYFILKYHARHHTRFLHRLTRLSVKTHLGRKEWWKKLSDYLDAPGEYEDTKSQMMVAGLDNDRNLIVNYMKGRAEVMVQDIIDNSGADKHHVYNILSEEVKAGRIMVTKEGYWGGPEIVSLTEK